MLYCAALLIFRTYKNEFYRCFFVSSDLNSVKYAMPNHNDSRQGTFILNDSAPDDDFPGIKHFFLADHNTSMEVREHFQRDPSKTRLQFLKPLGSGAYGDVYDAELIFLRTDEPGIFRWPCAAKRLKRHNGHGTPYEFILHQSITSDEHHRSSVESGVLTMIGIHVEVDEEGNETHWGIYPKCDAMLASWVPAISALQQTNVNLFCHVVHTVFTGFLRGLTTFASMKTSYADAKPLNTFFRKNGFGFLDLGSAQSYDNFFANPNQTQGSPVFIAPEVVVSASIDPFAADVFGCGQMLRQLLSLELLFCEETKWAAIYKAGKTYEAMRKENPIETIDTESIQKELCIKLYNAGSFISCLTLITQAMSEPLPERRPTLATLNYANESLLFHLKQPTVAEISAISAFYADSIWGNHSHQQADKAMSAAVKRDGTDTVTETIISLQPQDITRPVQHEDRGRTPPTTPTRRAATPTPLPSPISLASAQSTPGRAYSTFFAGKENASIALADHTLNIDIAASSTRRCPSNAATEAPTPVPPPTLIF